MYFCSWRQALGASAVAVGALWTGPDARADDGVPPAASASGLPARDSRRPPPSDRATSAPAPVRVGVLGGVGFPRPLAIDGLVILSGRVALGAEYGALPPVTVAQVRTSLWSFAADARVFPFGGPFFAGMRFGYQHLEATTTIAIPRYGSALEALSIDTWFLNPGIGILWASRPGLAVGTQAGLQIPIGPSIASTLPLSLLPGAQTAVETLGNSVIPTVDLLRVGGVL
jgi:hypothetical protein